MTRLRFLVNTTWKAFWSHPWRVVLMSTFLGLAVGLIWLSWDTEAALTSYLEYLWSTTGLPYQVRSPAPGLNQFTGDPYGPVDWDQWRQWVAQHPPQGPWIPWIQRETRWDGRRVTWVITRTRGLPRVRPWVRLAPPDAAWYVAERSTLTPPQLREWCERTRACNRDQPGHWDPGHEPLDILVDWDRLVGRWPVRTVNWIEGRWTGPPPAFRAWQADVERSQGWEVIADQPALARYRAIATHIRNYLRWTGAGLLVMGATTFFLVLLLDTYHRRYEWAIWMSMGASPLSLGHHFGVLTGFWGIAVFVAANLMYWLGRWSLARWLPELAIHPSLWEGPVVALLGTLLCGLAMLPAYRNLRLLQPAPLLRGE